jgi:hypothetical protein
MVCLDAGQDALGRVVNYLNSAENEPEELLNLMHKDLSSIKKTRRRWLLATHIILLLWLCLAFAPVSTPETFIVEGVPIERKFCGRSCDTAIQIKEVILGCAASPLGLAYSCAKNYDSQIPARATYFIKPTIFSTIGLSRESAILLTLEQNGQVLKDKSYSDLIFSYSAGCLLIFVIFAISYYKFSQSSYFRKEV